MADSYNLGKLNVVIDATTKPFMDAAKKVKEEAASITKATSSEKASPGIDLSGVTKELASIKEEISRITDLVKARVAETKAIVVNGGDTATEAVKKVKRETTTMSESMTKAKDKVTDIVKKMTELKDKKVPTEDYKYMSKEIDKAEKKLSDLLARQEQINRIGGKTGSMSYRKLTDDIEQAKRALSELKAEKASMEASGTAYTTGINTSEYIKLQQELDRANAKLNQQNSTLGRTATQGNKATSAVRRVASAARSTAAGLLSVGAAGIKGFARVTSSIKGALKNLIPFQGTMGRIMNTAKTVFFFGLFRRGFTEIRNYVGNVLAQNSQLSASLAQLKGNMLTAIQPVYEAILPALQSLINMLVTVSGYIAQFTAKIFGTSVKASQASAQALNKQANATNNVAKVTDKANKQLGKYDELNVISKDKSSDGGNSGTGTGTSGIAATFDDIQESSIVDKIISRLKEAFKTGDFTEIGVSVGAKLNDALSKIPWEDIKSTSGKIAKSIATFLNGFIKETDWKQVGKTIAEGFNTVLEFAYVFVTTFDWKKFGKSIGESVNGIFANIDWKKTAQTIGEGIKGILNSITEFIKEVDWSKIGADIVTFLANLDWFGMLTALVDIVVAANVAVVGLIVGVVAELGASIMDGLGQGISASEILTNTGKWIKDHLLDPIVNGFKKLFGIHSPSTVFSELGGFLMQGLIDGIKGLTGKISETISKVAGDIKNWFKEKLPSLNLNLKGKVENTFNKAKNAWNGMKSGTKNLIAKAKGKVEKAFDTVKSKWSGIKAGTKTVTAKAKAEGQKTLDKVKASLDWLKKNASIKIKPSLVTDAIKSAIKSIIVWINDYIIGALNKISIEIPSWVPKLGGKKFGFDINKIKTPQLEAGGVLRKGQTGYLEGNGDEAVVPLEQNTGWIDRLAYKLNDLMAGGGSLQAAGADYIVLNMDGEPFIKFIKNSAGEYKKQTGNSMFS